MAVEKEEQIVGHLSQGKSGRFTKNHGNACQVEVWGKSVNLDDGEGLQILCALRFSGEEKYFKKFTVLNSVIGFFTFLTVFL